MIEFSVVIPLYNKAAYIKRAINSILKQTYQEFEILVVDDGSTDGSGNIVASITDQRIRLFQQSNGGVSLARNRGINEAKYHYIAFLDADDEWENNYLENIVHLILEYPGDYVFTQSYKIVNNRGKFSKPPVLRQFSPRWKGVLQSYPRIASGGQPFFTSSICVNKIALYEVNGFPVGVKLVEDLIVWFKLSLKYRFVFLNSYSSIYHQDLNNSESQINKLEALTDFEDLLHSQYLNTNIELNIRQDIYEYYSRRMLMIAYRCIMTGQVECCHNMLDKSKYTKRHKTKWRKLWLLSHLPKNMLIMALSVKNRISKVLAIN